MIKRRFRGYVPDKGWITGCLCRVNAAGSGQKTVTDGPSDSFIMEDGKEDGEGVEAASVGMDIGLRDKNGRAVYEGDILEEDDGSRMMIKAHETEPCFVGVSVFGLRKEQLGGHVSYTAPARLAIVVPMMTVVGNMYENPELMELRVAHGAGKER